MLFEKLTNAYIKAARAKVDPDFWFHGIISQQDIPLELYLLLRILSSDFRCIAESNDG